MEIKKYANLSYNLLNSFWLRKIIHKIICMKFDTVGNLILPTVLLRLTDKQSKTI